MNWDSESVADSIRYEKKYFIHENDINTVVDHLKFNGFEEQYEPRSIRNIYFDTEDYRLFGDHVAGVMDRYKVRFRWYEQEGRDFILPAIEVKAKSGDIGFKYRFDLKEINDHSKITHKSICSNLQQEKIREELKQIQPNIYISYDRRYFRHFFQTDLRLTLDYNMQAGFYGDARGLQPLAEQTLCEVKYPPNAHTVDWNSAFGAGKLNQDLDLQPLRFSKYVTAVEKLFI